MATATESQGTLRRDLGVFGATMMGLGSILGTGIFVSVGIAAGATGPSVVLAIAVAALVATFNALSSAQLAANHPVSGGTYEYGYRWLTPALGFTAGWMFICAKAASAATAALGFAGYLFNALGIDAPHFAPIAATAGVGVITILVLSGLRRASFLNVAIVSLTIGSLAVFVIAGAPSLFAAGTPSLSPFFAPVDVSGDPLAGFFEASALMFVAYTGYGRIATLGEEIRDPRQNIPKAIVLTLLFSMLLYISVSFVAVGTTGAPAMAEATAGQAAPLEAAAREFGLPGVGAIVAVGAITAMLGVLLNLVLGLSRVVLAMARRGDLPRFLAGLGKSGTTPVPAVLLVGAIIAAMAAVGSVRATWSFSALTVLIYYAITNLAALRMTAAERLYPPLVAGFGLISCLFLTYWIEPVVWAAGLLLLATGVVVRYLVRRSDIA